VAIVSYHPSSSDPFYQYDAQVRSFTYYDVAYYPTAVFNGGDDWVVGGGVYAIDDYVERYDQWMARNAPGALSLKVDYDPVTRDGILIARFRLVDGIRDPDLHLRYVITESHIYHEWAYLDSLHFVVRDMLSGHDGIPFSINSGQTFVDTQSFYIDPDWVASHCELVAFVQDDNNRMVTNSNLLPLYQIHVSGDANSDLVVTLSDAVFLCNYVFFDGLQPDPSASGDPNEDCVTDVQDIAYLMDYLFYQGPVPLRGWEID
jgi:hypothetical protein